MESICKIFKSHGWVTTCEELNECKTVLQTKQNYISKTEYSSYVDTWNATLAAFDLYSVCNVLKGITNCVKVDCLNSPIKDVQTNINKCSGTSKRCFEWFSNKSQSNLDINAISGNISVSSILNQKIEIDNKNIDYYKSITNKKIKKGDSIYYLAMMINNNYVNSLHKNMGLDFYDAKPIISIYLTAEDVENLDEKITNEVNLNWMTFIKKAVHPVFPYDNTLTADWMKSCVYEVLNDQINEVKSWAPTEIQKHNEHNTLSDTLSNIKNAASDAKDFITPKLQNIKDTAKGVFDVGKKDLKQGVQKIKTKFTK